MSENKIKVTATTSTKPVRVSVSTPATQGNVTFSQDTSAYNANLAQQWAVSENLVLGQDYSSKYYANKAKESATNVNNTFDSIRETCQDFQDETNNAFNELNVSKAEVLGEIDIAKTNAVDSINTTKTTIITDIEFVADGEKEEIKDLVDTGKDELKEAIGDVKVLTTLKIGQIGIAPLGIDETLNMERYLNGQIIIQNQFKGFTKFLKRRIELYPSLACTEDEWQTTVTMSAFSQCGKFVIDDTAGTIRLPKVVNIQGLTDLSKLGEIIEAGLPNITGTAGWNYNGYNGEGKYSGALYKNTSNTYIGATGGGNLQNSYDLGFDASKSNATYGNSNTVQQEQIQYPYFIQVATGAETEDNIINEIELNNPFSFGDSKYSPKPLNNLSWLKSEGQWNSKAIYPSFYDWALTNFNNGIEGFALSTGEYTDYDVVINPAEETFRLPLLDGSESLPNHTNSNTFDDGVEYVAECNGFIFARRATSADNTSSYASIVINNVEYQFQYFNATNGRQEGSIFIPVTKGDVYTAQNTAIGTLYERLFIPAQGNGSLYFYVGETVQNANLINAGRIEEKLADLIPDNSSLIAGYGMPSNKYIDLTLGASGTTYTAPTNGWLFLRKISTAAAQYITMSAATLASIQYAHGSGNQLRVWLPVKKGENVIIDYTAGGDTKQFYFVSAVGSESEV